MKRLYISSTFLRDDDLTARIRMDLSAGRSGFMTGRRLEKASKFQLAGVDHVVFILCHTVFEYIYIIYIFYILYIYYIYEYDCSRVLFGPHPLCSQVSIVLCGV